MAASAERMSRVDHAWLRMDSDLNLMMIVGVWLLRPRLSYRALCRRIEQRLLQYPRFRQKVVEDALGAQWVDDADFDIGHHVVRERLARRRAGSEREALQARCGELAMTRLDPARPLWQFHLIEQHDGGSALIVRIHHCIGDGIALTAVLMSITDGGELPPRSAPTDAAHDPHHDEDGLWGTRVKPLSELALRAIDGYGQGVARSLEFAAQPLAGTRELARIGLRAATDLAALALMEDDSPTPLKGKPIGRKLVAWADPVPLDVVKAVGKALRASVNDVLLACVAAAIGAYLRDIGQDTRGKSIRAMVPVNLRPLHQAHQLGNRFGLVPLLLPIGVDNPVERVARHGAWAAQGQLPAGAGAGRAGGERPLHQAGAGRRAGHLRQEGHGRDDQRARPRHAAQVLRRHAAPDHVLGACLGQHRRRRVHPQLRRRRAVRAHHRPEAVPRAAGHHRPL
jgi:WS/DGAT/MGAT family acyltransferase